jgi:hypothetical protein
MTWSAFSRPALVSRPGASPFIPRKPEEPAWQSLADLPLGRFSCQSAAIPKLFSGL